MDLKVAKYFCRPERFLSLVLLLQGTMVEIITETAEIITIEMAAIIIIVAVIILEEWLLAADKYGRNRSTT